MTLRTFTAAILVLLSTAAIPVAAGQDAHNTKKLEVVIVSVEHFDDQSYDNALLEQNIAETTNRLIAFFNAHFPAAHVTVLRSHDDTSSAHLMQFFKGEFPKIANGNITLLFMLSHGESLQSSNPIYGSDVGIISSTTSSSDVVGQSLSLTEDVINRANGLAPGTMIFAFIDTCHSGAAANLGLALDDAVRNALGVKMMVMASSLSDQLDFQASLTRALLDRWTQVHGKAPPYCTVPEVSAPLLRQDIARLLYPTVLGSNEGYPKVLLHYEGEFCLETFDSDSGIATVINGTADSYVAKFVDEQGISIDEPIDGHEVVPVRLLRRRYKLSLYKNDQALPERSFDLTKQAVAWTIVGAPDAETLGAGFERAAAAGVSVGVGGDSVTNVQQLAYAAFTLAKDSRSSERLAKELASSAGNEWVLNQKEASKPAKQLVAALSHQNLDTAKATAVQLQRFGNFEAAATVWEFAATSASASGDSRKNQFAAEAYLAYTASGETTHATEVQNKFKLVGKTLCWRCGDLQTWAETDPVYSEELGDIGINLVFENLEKEEPPVLSLLPGAVGGERRFHEPRLHKKSRWAAPPHPF